MTFLGMTNEDHLDHLDHHDHDDHDHDDQHDHHDHDDRVRVCWGRMTQDWAEAAGQTNKRPGTKITPAIKITITNLRLKTQSIFLIHVNLLSVLRVNSFVNVCSSSIFFSFL